MSHHDHILASARELFASHGIAATTIQDIADHSGSSKANVLYHFHSKDQLVNDALTPALEAMAQLLDSARGLELAEADKRQRFLDTFVGFLLEHRLAIHIVVSHPYQSSAISSLGRARELMERMALFVSDRSASEDERLRFGVAVSGATYALVSSDVLGVTRLTDEELRPRLLDVLNRMLAPNSVGVPS